MIFKVKIKELKPDEGDYTWQKVTSEVGDVLTRAFPYRRGKENSYTVTTTFDRDKNKENITIETKKFSLVVWWKIRAIIKKYRK